ncbi:N-acyl-D-amino-acid deacylase family protein [Kineobactrum salinum]|uniref:Amidohydrolase family protein n=1 Tax=Kineobactrum salinum TaxID=2708301 RepID=A0A6C0U984_9GAMM|nr:amidohydrolase family protein [Kineobactrum salinum]QIB66184.1 amidohydrolase family protein [Kineobactrum salinum]
MRKIFSVVAIMAGGLAMTASASSQSLDILIRNGSVYDGTGSPPINTDVGIADGKIVLVGSASPEQTAETVIDAQGMAVSPGFIDTHSHILESVVNFDGPFIVTQNLAQGVTTSALGSDGGMSPNELQTLFEKLDTNGVSNNWFCYVGHNGVRTQVMGHAKREATSAELNEMKALVRDGMEMGCSGLSAGLMYDPGMYSAPEEIVELAKATAPYDGTYDSHSRNPVTDFLNSELETAEIGIKAGIPAKLGHIKAVGLSHKGKANTLIERVDALRTQGHDIVGDVYPYDGAQTRRLAAVLVFPGEGPIGADRSTASIMDLLREKLKDSKSEAALKQATEQGVDGGFSWIKAVGYDSVRIVDAPQQPELLDQYITLLADERGQDPFDTMTDLLLDAKGDIIVTVGAMDEADVQAFILAPWNMISSDGSYIGPESVYGASPHPRSSGSFARVLGHYSRDLKLLPLEEVIRKLTSLPADHLRIHDRGRIEPGLAGDIVIFDPSTITDHATYAHPKRLATGVMSVILNGELVWKDGKPTGAAPGKFISRQTK